jgi:hypothetical protein
MPCRCGLTKNIDNTCDGSHKLKQTPSLDTIKINSFDHKIFLYTLEGTGTNFMSTCLSELFKNTVVSHNKDEAYKYNRKINYKEYNVYSTIRNPKESLFSIMYLGYEKNSFTTLDEEIIDVERLIKKQEAYMNELIDNKDFYIMPFEYFTKDTKNFFLKLIKENEIPDLFYNEVLNNNFFKDPLANILSYGKVNKKRYPREKNIHMKIRFEELSEISNIKNKIEENNKLYEQLKQRYDNGQQMNRVYIF